LTQLLTDGLVPAFSELPQDVVVVIVEALKPILVPLITSIVDDVRKTRSQNDGKKEVRSVARLSFFRCLLLLL
jgi:hypothetical protein